MCTKQSVLENGFSWLMHRSCFLVCSIACCLLFRCGTQGSSPSHTTSRSRSSPVWSRYFNQVSGLVMQLLVAPVMGAAMTAALKQGQAVQRPAPATTATAKERKHL